MILALKTDGSITHAWLLAGAQNPTAPEHHLEWESGRALSEQLLGKLADFLTAHDQSFADLTGIVIFSGPGSFTSLRIGHATANALADSLNIPVVGKMGEDWQVAGHKALIQAQPGHPALPHYGAEAHITRSRS